MLFFIVFLILCALVFAVYRCIPFFRRIVKANGMYNAIKEDPQSAKEFFGAQYEVAKSAGDYGLTLFYQRLLDQIYDIEQGIQTGRLDKKRYPLWRTAMTHLFHKK